MRPRHVNVDEPEPAMALKHSKMFSPTVEMKSEGESGGARVTPRGEGNSSIEK